MTKLQAGALLFVFWNSISDICKKEISMLSVLVFSIVRLFYLLFCTVQGQVQLAEIIAVLLMGMLPGLILCVMGRVSRGAIGMGDGIVVVVIGLYIGWKQTITMMMYALFFAFLWSVALLITKKYTQNSRFPFVPFLFIGQAFNIWL